MSLNCAVVALAVSLATEAVFLLPALWPGSLALEIVIEALQFVALIVMTGAIPVLMLAFWQLGGLTPTPLALTAQAAGWLAVAVWCVTHLLFVAGALSIDYDSPATGAVRTVRSATRRASSVP